MLVLTRRPDQTITLGDPKSGKPPIEVTLIEIKGDQVRLGISAPRDTPVHRKEIWLQVQQENQAAAGTNAVDVPKMPNVPRR